MTQLTLTFLAESEASPSQRGGRASAPLDSAKSIPSAGKSCKSTGQKCPTSETSENLDHGQTLEMFPSLPEAFRASRFPSPGSAEARAMTATSGRQCATLLDESDPLGCLVRTCLESSAWNSTECLLTWRALAIGSNRLLFRLVPSMPSTEGIESGLWPTPNVCGGGNPPEILTPHQGHFLRPSGKKAQFGLDQAVKLWPTPEAVNQEGYQVSGGKKYLRLGAMAKLFPTPRAMPGNFSKVNGKIYETSLQSMARRGLLPTPTSSDWKGPNLSGSGSASCNSLSTLVAQQSGQLNPAWVEWLMGYPTGHTDLKGSETPSSRKSRLKSSGKSEA